jgi:hypothetical protein
MAHDQEAMLAGIIAKLSVTGVGTLYEAVNGRIYRTVAPSEDALPLVIVSVADDAPDRYFSTAADILATINVSVFGKRDASETTLQGIAGKVITALENATITISGHVGGTMWIQNRGITIYDDSRVQITTLWGIAATST